MFIPQIFEDMELQDAFEIMMYAQILKTKCSRNNWDPHKVLDVDFETAMSNELENKI